MRILFTGGSSCTGTHLIRELRHAGHEVVATLTRSPESYEGVRRIRVQMLIDSAKEIVGGTRFGDERFLRLLREHGPFDLLAQHAAHVDDYKSPDFDVQQALENNTHNLPRVLDTLGKNAGVLLTGSVFEMDEGAGSGSLSAFSPYGLSKGLTAQVFRYHCAIRAIPLAKFVIPNPFGPFEEPRFTSYLAQSWFEGRTPVVATPDYVRDNIHTSLLAKAYRWYAEEFVAGRAGASLHPSGYPESQGAFARRFAEALRPRLGLPCELELSRQTEFPEPHVRINTDVLDSESLDWDENRAWDELAAYYRETFRAGPLP